MVTKTFPTHGQLFGMEMFTVRFHLIIPYRKGRYGWQLVTENYCPIICLANKLKENY